MPLYDYKCPTCGETEERAIKLADLCKPVSCLRGCGPMKRQLSAPRIQMDYAGYSCPITGKWIEGRRAHKENLKVHGCRVLERGEFEEVDKRRKRADDELEEKVANGAVQEFLNMSIKKREMIAHELTHGADAPIIRK